MRILVIEKDCSDCELEIDTKLAKTFGVAPSVLAKALGLDHMTVCNDLSETFVRVMLRTGAIIPAEGRIYLGPDGDPGIMGMVLDVPDDY